MKSQMYVCTGTLGGKLQSKMNKISSDMNLSKFKGLKVKKQTVCEQDTAGKPHNIVLLYKGVIFNVLITFLYLFERNIN